MTTDISIVYTYRIACTLTEMFARL